MLNAHTKAVWENGYPNSQASSSTANVSALGLVNVGVAETSSSVATDASGAMTSSAHMHLADISVAGIVKIDALDAAVSATASGQPNGAQANSDVAPVKLSIPGIPYEIQSGQVINVPGVAKVSLGEANEQMDPNGLQASVSGNNFRTSRSLGPNWPRWSPTS